MQQIFTDSHVQLNSLVTVTGADAHHLAQVVRIRHGEKLRVSTAQGQSFIGRVEAVDRDAVQVVILEEVESTELAQRVMLFQGLVKGERMEAIIEKATELGAATLVPVTMKNCVVKLDDKKQASRGKRYQAIAEAAAKQSKRSVLPCVEAVMSFEEAIEYAKANCELILLPYECARGMEATAQALAQVPQAGSIAIFIGPEGGFDAGEVERAKADGAQIISLGKRILRADTAAITAVSMVMLACEGAYEF